MKSEIKTYYDQIAAIYDHDRFGNSYGQFIDRQEKRILEHLLIHLKQHPVLDLGCGTGRLTYLATHGVDVSTAMLDIAQSKYPEKQFTKADAFDLPFENNTFEAVFSMHMVMHFEHSDLKKLLLETYRVLKPGGQFILDFPSKKRRNLFNTKPKSWHGANSYNLEEVMLWTHEDWILSYAGGILLLPIHRFPIRLRPLLLRLDGLLCRSFLQNYSSYLIISLVKK